MERESSEDRLIPLLAAVRAGEAGASDRLADAVHEDLRAMARRKLEKNFGKNLGGITIQPTMLANDTLLRLLRQRSAYDNAGHLFAVASRLMMRILIDYCRPTSATTRPGSVGCCVKRNCWRTARTRTSRRCTAWRNPPASISWSWR